MTSEINKAVSILKKGGLVAFPTETVYGLGADATNERALSKIFTAKERPKTHPLIVHVANVSQLADWAVEIPKTALLLAKAFWPGPLTLILKKQPHVLDMLSGGQDTIGLRIPRHPVAMALLEAFQQGVAAPSANKFTHISPTTKVAVEEELGSAVDLILEGGACEVGLESTIIDLSQATPTILRPGMITAADLSRVLGTTVSQRRQDSPVRTPGMHHLHYAPTTKTRLLSLAAINALIIKQRTALVMINTPSCHPSHLLERIQLSSNPNQYAHDLYHTLRALDQGGYQEIIIESPPSAPEWDAIRDRVEKASGG